MIISARRKWQGIAPLAAAMTAVLAAPSVNAADATIQPATITPGALANTRFVFGGFVKLDAMWTGYSDGQIADPSPGRDFYVPSTIPVVAPTAPELTEGVAFNSHIKQSRFMLGTDTDVNGGKISSRFEFDLYGSAISQLGDTRNANTYGVQVRHAYIQYKQWMVGQTWSNFQDPNALPETADYIGQLDGLVFVRQPQVRYTTGGFSIALENSQTTVSNAGTGARITTSDNSYPDLSLAYTGKFPSGYVRFGLLARQLSYRNRTAVATTNIDSSTTSVAGMIAGKISFGKDDIRFNVVGGSGIGRYVGFNVDNDAELNGANNEIHAITGWAAYVAYRHVWNGASTWRSTIMGSESNYSNNLALLNNTVTSAVNKGTASGAINLFYSPMPKLDLGIELRVAQLEKEANAYVSATHPSSSTTGQMKRVEVTTKYSF